MQANMSAALAALFPPRCSCCQQALSLQTAFGLCPLCEELLADNDGERCSICDLPGVAQCHRCREQSPAFARARAPLLFGGPVADLLRDLKFSGQEEHAIALGNMLAADAIAEQLAVGRTLVPIPLARQRLDVLVRSTDGFEIAEMDLRLRGPGQVLGTRQSGLPDLALASLADDGAVLDALAAWVPDTALRNRILSGNPARLYGFDDDA